MSTRRLLYLNSYRLTALRWEGRALTSEAIFETTDEGRRLFVAYLSLHAKSVFSLLINPSEEGFQIETLPFLRGVDRRAIIKRKLGQLFFNAPLTTSISLGHEKSRRKNERVLLAAITNADFYRPWLEALRSARVALSGIYSLPFVGSLLLDRLKLAEERCLLLTVQDQSVRQSYFEKGKLQFSRLTPLQNSSIGGIAQTFASEAHKLQLYLASQRLIGRSEPIAVYVLAHSGARQAIEARCTDTSTLHFKLLTLEDCARTIGMGAQPASSHCESLFLHLLAVTAPRNQFASEEQQHFYRLWQLRYALYGAGAATLLCCLLLAGKLALDAYGVRQQAGQLAAEAGLARQRYESIAATFPPIPTSHDTLRRVINRYTELEKQAATPDSLYLAVSHALNAASAVRLDALDWTAGGPTGTPAGASVGDMRETAIARGIVQLGANATPRQVVAAFDKFLDALKSQPGVQVVVLQHPVELESGKSLKSGDARASQDKPDIFSVQIGRKFAP